jgi:hypothetical protein
VKQLFPDLSEADQRRVIAAFDCLVPRVLPTPWKEAEGFVNARWYQGRGLVVCLEVETVDGSLWLHVSMSRRHEVPDYSDLAEVKRTFVGPQRKAIMVLPAESEHYNLHPYCLHLYSPIDSDPLPDFRAAGGQL